MTITNFIAFFLSTITVPTLVNAAAQPSSDRGRGGMQQMMWLMWESAAESGGNATHPSMNLTMPAEANMPLNAFRFPYQTQIFEQLKGEMTQEQILFHHLFRRYNKAVRPVGEFGQVITIYVGMSLAQITDVDMRHQKMVARFWCDQEWVDHRLSWQPESFFRLQRLHVPHHKVWTPDIVLYNSVGQEEDQEIPIENNAMIRSDGTVFVAPVVLYHSFCRLDVTFFPFDYQFCWLKLGSWAHTGDVLDVEIRGDGIDTSNHMGNGEWELIGTRAVKNIKFYPCCPEPFPEIFFYFHLRRRILYYVFSVLAPCVIMSSVAMFAFCLPTECSEKVTLGLTILLAYTVFQLTTAESMPKTSEFLAYISIYFTVVILTTSLTVFSSIMVVGVKESGGVKGTYPPRFLLKLCAFFNLIPIQLVRSTDVFTPSKRKKALLKKCCGIDKLPHLRKAVFIHKQPALFEFHIRDDFNLLGKTHSPFCRLVPNVAENIFQSNIGLMDLEIVPPREAFFRQSFDNAGGSSLRTWNDHGITVVDVDDGRSERSERIRHTACMTEVVLENNMRLLGGRQTVPKIRLLPTADFDKLNNTFPSYGKKLAKDEDGDNNNTDLLVGLKSQAMRREAGKAAEEIKSAIDRVINARFVAREWVAMYVALDTVLFYLFITIHLVNTLGFIIVVPLMVPNYSLDYLVAQHVQSLNVTQ